MGDPSRGWEELNRALEKVFPKSGRESREIRIRFRRGSRGEDAEGDLVIETEDIDNCYDEENGWRWAIFLHEDGTWSID